MLLHNHVARQHRPNLVFKLERAVRELRIVRLENPVGTELLAELSLHRRLGHVRNRLIEGTSSRLEKW
jgi:hypothetical protein